MGIFKAGQKLVMGVGYNDGTYPSTDMKEHALWRSMLARCYSEHNLKRKPSYRGCEVSENFRSYTFFYEWCQAQVGFNCDGWCLDKDLLKKGNKVYSEDLCVFIPMAINNAIVKADALRGEYPIGVSFDKARLKFQARLWVNSKPKSLGRYSTPEEAFSVYKREKEKHLKEIANKWESLLDRRAYNALVNYTVDISD